MMLGSGSFKPPLATDNVSYLFRMDKTMPDQFHSGKTVLLCVFSYLNAQLKTKCSMGHNCVA